LTRLDNKVDDVNEAFATMIAKGETEKFESWLSRGLVDVNVRLSTSLALMWRRAMPQGEHTFNLLLITTKTLRSVGSSQLVPT
jgi:hypothetical protein